MFPFLVIITSVFFDKIWKIDIHRADGTAGLAVNAVSHNCPVVFLSVVKKGQYQTDGTDVNMAVFMPAHFAVNGANIRAGAASNAS